MSEEKLYMVKNDDGEYWDFNYSDFWRLESAGCYETTIKVQAEIVAKEHGGHVVTLIEEPEKVVLTKEQAEIVEGAHDVAWPANYISGSGENECLLINAYVNGYTVEKEKKYIVKVPKKWSGDDKHYWMKRQDGSLMWVYYKDYMIPAQQLTEAEIEHYELQDCEKMEVKD